MKKWTVRLNSIGGKGGVQHVTVEGHDHNAARRTAEQLYGKGNVTDVRPA